MTAVKVYGTAIGDSFKSSDGSVTLTITEFITPENLVKPWEARVVTQHGTAAIIGVKDLLGSGYDKVEA